MRISCEMVEDLLPLYLDDSCSKDSRIAVEEHLRACQDCRDKLSRMQSDIMDDRQEPAERTEPDLTELAEKIRRHRIRVAGFEVLAIMMLSVLLTLGYLTVQDMYSQMHPYVHEVEEGTQNLAAGACEMRAEQIEQAFFYTNNTQIKVSVQAGEGFQGTGTIKLWNMIYKDDFIQTADVEGAADSVLFTGLSSADRYKITCEGLDGAVLTVSDGRSVSFWKSLKSVLWDIVLYCTT